MARPEPRRAWLGLLALLAICAAGCREELETRYGQRTGPFASKSVNGTAVLADMFQQAGFRVTEWMSLSPRLERAGTIVWFPDDFEPPKPKVRKWLEKWLDAKPDRTLIYVGRDFDAAPWYWKQVEPDAPGEQRDKVRESRVSAARAFERERKQIPEWDSCGDWFAVEREERLRRVTVLDADTDWREGIDPAGLEIELHGRTLPMTGTEVLLASRGDMLVGRQEIGTGRLFVVANGSFLLNAMLVNHEHRKLAAKLIDAVGEAKGADRVVFLESGAGGPPIHDDDPAGMRSGLEIFQQWPTNWILMQLAVVGVIFCFSKFLIFGRPIPPDAPGTSDFGKHVAAVAAMLRRSRDASFAQARAKHYQQLVKKTDMKE